MKLTEAQKSDLYDKHSYSFPAPGVCTAYWTRADWIRYIDLCGVWNTDSVENRSNT